MGTRSHGGAQPHQTGWGRSAPGWPPEYGHMDEYHGHDADGVVGNRVLTGRAEQAQRNGDQVGDDQGEDAQLQRSGQLLGQDGVNGDMVKVGVPKSP